ncbi:hypothetical protein D3869_20845 (plasmid) [Azospirillum brasilense]|uniref:Tubulin-like protein n=1 Tax=Azospirillum brasilense TaxID=192 RepID=A0A4D8RAP8_AZOBR|nr:tubulin-like doman-containing protein [Azospirillum brasilense]QCO17646.1 hypothetical protein D3869_20845 [Azospirillum brasilense]
MSIDTQFVKRFPALVIGLGGTGVRTLRYLRWQAENGSDSGLRRMYADGHLQLLAIDTDWKANREEELDEHVVPRASSFREGGANAFERRLPTIEPIITIGTDAIVRSVDALRQSPRRSAGMPGAAESRDDESPVPAITEWLPSLNLEALNEMSLGQARYEGAGQWRPLGRIGLFTEARTIYDKLRDCHQKVRSVTERAKPVRVHLVCSLSGGTGAGIFWDVALMMRNIDPECELTGSFLMADPFIASDRAERVEVNAYAALKELSVYKNWRLRPDEIFKVRYPIGREGMTVQARRGDSSVFKFTYLYQSFMPEGEPAVIPDLAATTIRMSCFRMAENILAQLRHDVRAKLDEAADNDKTDVKSALRYRERGFVFSTSAVTSLALAETGEMARTLEAAILNRLIDDIGTRRPIRECRPIKLDLLHAIPTASGGVPGPELPGTPGGQLFGEERTLRRLETASLVGLWRTAAVAGGPPQSCARIAGMRKALDAMQGRIAELTIRQKKPDELRENARELYDLVDEALRQPWAAAIGMPGWSSELGVAAIKAELDPIDLCTAELDEFWTPLARALAALGDGLERDTAVLDDEGLTLLRAAVKELDDRPPPDDCDAVTLTAPPSLIQMRIALGIVNEGRDAALIHHQETYGSGPLHIIMGTFRERLDAGLADAARQVLDPASWSGRVEQYLYRNRERLAGDIRRVLEVHDRNHRLLTDRGDDLRTYGVQVLRDPFIQINRHAERFDRMIAPLPDSLHALLNDSLPDRIEALLGDLNQLFVRDALREEWKVRTHFQDSASRRAVWKALMKDVVAATKHRQDPQDAPTSPLVHVLAELLDRHFLRPGGAGHRMDAIRDKTEFEHLKALARLYANGFVRFWSEQEAFIIARLNGDKGLEELIARCRSAVFSKGSVAPTIQQAKLVIGKPQISRSLSLARGESDRNALMNRLKTAAQKVLNITPTFTEEASPVPIIYYEELYRPGAEISGIQRYHRRYRESDDRFRSLYHFQRGGEALENLIPDELSPDAVLCGNRGCTFDLSRLPDRDALICPGCGGPILNRCGNPSCEVDDLTSRFPSGAFGTNGRPMVRQCPECKGELKTYWWFCKEAAHGQRPISMRETNCPQCLDDYAAGRRPLSQVQIRHDRDPFDCPGCVSHRLPPQKRTRVPGALRRFFYDGVSGSERHEFDRLIEEHHLPEIRCPSADAPDHLLFPALEMKEDSRKWLDHVHRTKGMFSAEQGVPQTRFSCFHCGYPVPVAEAEQASTGKPVACRRCLRLLQPCPYCSSSDGTLLRPMPSPIGAPRCPRCTNLMLRNREKHHPYAAEGLVRPGFCRNLFSCDAGARPWSTAAEYDHGDCRACVGGGHVPLLPFDQLLRHVNDCPVCLTLLGRCEDNRFQELTRVGLMSHFIGRPPEKLPQYCMICGCQPRQVLLWMKSSDYFSGGGNAITAESQEKLSKFYNGPDSVPQIPADFGMEILESLLGNETERHLYEKLTKLEFIRDGQYDLPTIETQIGSLFRGSHISARMVRCKLKAMVLMSEEVRSREQAFILEEAGSF